MKITELQNDKISNHNTINDDLVLERDALREENQLFKNALDQWSTRYEEIRLENEQITQYIIFPLRFYQFKFVFVENYSKKMNI